MATDARTTTARLDLYRLDIVQLRKAMDAGVFTGGSRSELLGGLLVRRLTKNTPHSYSQMRLQELLGEMIERPWRVCEEKPIELGRYWRPEPDISILKGPTERYRFRSPVLADVAFLIEVADTTYRIDRGPKWRGYASTGVPIYWIVNLNARQVEVYRDPTGNGGSAFYQVIEVFGIDALVPVRIDSVEVGRIAVGDTMP